MPESNSFNKYFEPTYFIDSDSSIIKTFAKEVCQNEVDPVKKAIKLYYAVRDGIKYDPYSMEDSRSSMVASTILQRKFGYCVAKAVVLTALARSQQIPVRLGFADVKNHINSERLKALMETDLFVYHGFVELYLNEKWVKATPAFDLSLCEKAFIKPLEFDGTFDSIFHEFNTKGSKHMEYVKDHGHFADLPYDRIMKAGKEHYPLYFKNLERRGKDFSSETIRND
ncbi:MAG: transglutaminase domain-containing protein [Desulfobacteraceae bacterium]|nr:transglutaminase domain-containing protein [Desulfobacteraceae bacterium]